jgi:hypothetical protein
MDLFWGISCRSRWTSEVPSGAIATPCLPPPRIAPPRFVANEGIGRLDGHRHSPTTTRTWAISSECYSPIRHHEVTRHREPARDPAQLVERANCYAAMSLRSPLARGHAPCIMVSQLRFEATQSRGAVMYVVVEPHGGWIFAFGATPEKADADYVRRDIWYDGPSLDTRRCSPALYRQLKAAPDDNFIARCRINSKGVAVLRSDRIGVLPLGRPRAIHLRKGQPCT